MTDPFLALKSLEKAFDILSKAKCHFQTWASKAHGDEKEQLKKIRSYVAEWDVLVTKLRVYTEKARIFGDDNWPIEQKEKIEQLGHEIDIAGHEGSPLLGLPTNYRNDHLQLYKTLVFKFSSEGAGNDIFDSEDDLLFPQAVTLPKFIEWIEFLEGAIQNAIKELNKHIDEGCKGC